MASWSDTFQAAFGPIVGAGITLLATRISQREKLSATIIWNRAYYRHSAPSEEPFLHIQNRSIHPVLVSKIFWRRGLFRPRIADEFPLDYEDPTEIDFPYAIAAGEMRRFVLDTRSAKRVADCATPLTQFASRWARRPYLWIEIQTIAGTRMRISASDATPWRDRPAWLENTA